tara:strand:+ start:3972 stop:8129 length:4158 start_codon:yes stop_codon:yes gene_type:complete
MAVINEKLYYQANSDTLKDRTFAEAARDNTNMLLDMYTFLKSQRKGYTQDELEKMDLDDIIGEVNEHFRVGMGGAQNIVTITKDFNFLKDEKNTDAEKEAYSRLYEAFTNQGEQEGFSFEKITDYAEGFLTDPANIASAAVGLGTFGLGTAAVQAGKTVGKKAAINQAKKELKKIVQKKLLKETAVVAGVDAALGAATGTIDEFTKARIAENVNKDYKFSMANVAKRAALQSAVGATTVYGLGKMPTFNLPFTRININRSREDEAMRIFDAVQKGIKTQKAVYKDANAAANQVIKDIKITKKLKTKEGQVSQDAVFKEISKRLSFIDKSKKPLNKDLVQKGQNLKIYNLLSEETRDNSEVVGGFDVDTLKRIAAAGMDLVKTLDVDVQYISPVPRVGKEDLAKLRLTIKNAEGKVLQKNRQLKKGEKPINFTVKDAEKLDEAKQITQKYNLTDFEFASIYDEPSIDLRITEKLADAIRYGIPSSDNVKKTLKRKKPGRPSNQYNAGVKLIQDLKTKYKLSDTEFSSLFAAEFSEAGKKLQIASQLANIDRRDQLAKLTTSLEKLFEPETSPFSPISSQRIVDEAKDQQNQYEKYLDKGVTYRKAYDFLRALSDSRIAFMTTQIATTARNTIFGGIYVGLDSLDYTAANVYRLMSTGTVREEIEKQVSGQPIVRTAKDMSLVERFNIFDGSFDVVKSLTINRSEAEAMQALLQQPYAKELNYLFNSRGLIESEMTSNSKLLNVATKLNVLNQFSDHQFKRAVLMGNLNRRLKAAPNADVVGRNIFEVMQRGTANQVDERVFLKSVDEAYNKSFQTQFGLYGEVPSSKKINTAINYWKSTIIGTLAIPFPRFVLSQAKFINDYIPIPFLVKGQISKRVDFRPQTIYPNDKYRYETIDPFTGEPMFKAISKYSDAENFGKAIAGTIALAGGFLFAYHKADQGYNWNEYPIEKTGKTGNIAPILGPLALHFLVGDFIYRLYSGKEVDLPKFTKEVSKTYVGTDLRVSNPVAKISRYAIRGDYKKLVEYGFDVLASFTYPAAILKDIVGQFDPRSAMIPDTSDYEGNIFEFLGVKFSESSLKRAARFLPDFGFFDYGRDAPEFVVDDQEINDKYKSKGVPGQNMYDSPLYTPFNKYPLQVDNPLFYKQIGGLGVVNAKSTLQKEMSRLQIDEFEQFRDYEFENKFMKVVVARSMSQSFPDEMEAIIGNKIPTNALAVKNKYARPIYYNDLINDNDRRNYIISKIKKKKAKIRENLNNEMDKALQEVKFSDNVKTQNVSDWQLLIYLRGKFEELYNSKSDNNVYNYYKSLKRLNDEYTEEPFEGYPLYDPNGEYQQKEYERREFDMRSILLDIRKNNKSPTDSPQLINEITMTKKFIEAMKKADKRIKLLE